MSKRGSLTYQVEKQLSDKFSFGESKHKQKLSGGMEAAKEGIFAFNTARTYLRECIHFVKWVKKYWPETRTLSDCRPHIRAYLSRVRKRNGEHYSAASLATKASAIAKLYGIKKFKTPERTREGISRSRNNEPGTYEANHPEIVQFCDSTGLRRHELETLRGDQKEERAGRLFLRIMGNQAKGGKPRVLPVIGDADFVRDVMDRAGGGKVFGKVSKNMDIHAHRAKYAAELYQQRARPLDVCKREPFYDQTRGVMCANSVYWCRKDQAGTWFDKKAMLYVSRALGHNRISVIAEHYLYQLTKRGGGRTE